MCHAAQLAVGVDARLPIRSRRMGAPRQPEAGLVQMAMRVDQSGQGNGSGAVDDIGAVSGLQARPNAGNNAVINPQIGRRATKRTYIRIKWGSAELFIFENS